MKLFLAVGKNSQFFWFGKSAWSALWGTTKKIGSTEMSHMLLLWKCQLLNVHTPHWISAWNIDTKKLMACSISSMRRMCNLYFMSLNAPFWVWLKTLLFIFLLPLERQPPLWLIEKLSGNSSIFAMTRNRGSVTMRVTSLWKAFFSVHENQIKIFASNYLHWDVAYNPKWRFV